MSSRPHLRGTANAGSGGGNPVASRPIGSAALEPAHSDRSVETERPQHQNAGPHTKRPTSSLPFGDQRTTACVERTKGTVTRDRLDELEKVPLALRLAGRLDLHQIHVVHHAAVLTQLAVLGKE